MGRRTRSKIDDAHRKNASDRAMANKLTVINHKCERCHHNKAFSRELGIKCCRCGHESYN